MEAKIIRAVPPYVYPKGGNFKLAAYRAWQAEGGGVSSSHYPPRLLHALAFHVSLPAVYRASEARLRFAEAMSLRFDAFPDYACHEVVPFIWDCWPCYFEATCDWFAKYGVRTAVFTSSQTADRMKRRFPQMNILYVPEGIDTQQYGEGKPLYERRIDLFEIGSVKRSWYKKRYADDYSRLCSIPPEIDLATAAGFRSVMADTKVSIMFPKCYAQPEETGDIETLTQRYWEAMLSRMIMVGKAPRELAELIGYNPVITLDTNNPTQQIEEIVRNIGDYQPLADRNRATALAMGDWRRRMNDVMNFLKDKGYNPMQP